jgi:hypothetical protein
MERDLVLWKEATTRPWLELAVRADSETSMYRAVFQGNGLWRLYRNRDLVCEMDSATCNKVCCELLCPAYPHETVKLTFSTNHGVFRGTVLHPNDLWTEPGYEVAMERVRVMVRRMMTLAHAYIRL